MSTGTWSLRTNSSANWLAMRPAPMMPTFVTFLRELLVGRADGTLRALLHEIEGIHGCRELIAGHEFGERLVLAGEALGLRAALRLVEQLERGVGRLRHRADAALEHAARHLDRDRPLGEALDLARLVLAVDLDRAAEHAVGPRERVLEVVRRGEDRVDDPVVERLLGLQHPVLLERVRDDDLERVLDADEVRQQVRAAPPGDDAEEHLGQRDRGGRGIHRPVRRVEGDLESAAEREPVDEGERGHAEVRRACRTRGGRAARSAARCPSSRPARCR